jgi:hypothetical protein
MSCAVLLEKENEIETFHQGDISPPIARVLS